jgi:hypothetical protein
VPTTPFQSQAMRTPVLPVPASLAALPTLPRVPASMAPLPALAPELARALDSTSATDPMLVSAGSEALRRHCP